MGGVPEEGFSCSAYSKSRITHNYVHNSKESVLSVQCIAVKAVSRSSPDLKVLQVYENDMAHYGAEG